MTIFFDMDGVLANFNKSSYSLIKKAGLPAPDPADWHYLFKPMYREPVKTIAGSQNFWLKLEPFPEAVEAFNLVKDKSYILSSPGFAVSATPKLEWCRKHLGIKDNRVILTAAKHLLASSKRWLIDDKSGNCMDFIKAGGRALLVKHPYSFNDGELTEDEFKYAGGYVTSLEELPKLVKTLFVEE